MNLHEIIEHNDSQHTEAIEYGTLKPYMDSLISYYYDFHNTSELILLVFSVTNATAYCKIIAASDYEEAVSAYFEDSDKEDTTEENEAAREAVSANSSFLRHTPRYWNLKKWRLSYNALRNEFRELPAFKDYTFAEFIKDHDPGIGNYSIGTIQHRFNYGAPTRNYKVIYDLPPYNMGKENTFYTQAVTKAQAGKYLIEENSFATIINEIEI